MTAHTRPIRIDLDGVPLDDEDGRTTAIFRFRTTQGLLLLLPESVEVTVPFSDLDEASLLKNADAACHGERLDLIVRDIDHGCTQIGLNVLQLDAQFRTELRIER